MSDKELSLGSALKKTGSKAILPIGTLITANMFTPSIDSDAAKAAFYEWIKIPETNELVEKSHPDFRRELEREHLAEKYAWEVTEEQLSDPKYMKQYMKRIWDKEIDDPTREQCLVCSKASEVDEIVFDAAEKLGRDPYIELAQMWSESRFDPKSVSKRKARGDKQIKWIACKEVYDIMKNLDKANPPKRHRSYIKSKGDALAFYKDMFSDLEETKKRYLNHSTDREFNILSGMIYSDFLGDATGEENEDGLTVYLNGERMFNKNPDEARDNAKDYIKEITENRDVFKRCDELRNSVYKNNFSVISAHKDLT